MSAVAERNLAELVGDEKVFDSLDEARNILEQVSDLAKQKGELELVPVDELVDLYMETNPAHNAAKKLRDVARDALLHRMDEGDEDVGNGYVRFRSRNSGYAVEFRPRLAVKFAADKATSVLKKLGLLPKVTRVEYRVSDFDKLRDFVEELQDALKSVDPTKAQYLEGLMDEAIERQEVLDEEGAAKMVEALVKKGTVPLSVAEEMYESKTTYALHESK